MFLGRAHGGGNARRLLFLEISGKVEDQGTYVVLVLIYVAKSGLQCVRNGEEGGSLAPDPKC